MPAGENGCTCCIILGFIVILASFITPCVLSGMQAFDGQRTAITGLYLRTYLQTNEAECQSSSVATRSEFNKLKPMNFNFKGSQMRFWADSDTVQDTTCCTAYGKQGTTRRGRNTQYDIPAISFDQIETFRQETNFSISRVIFQDGDWFNKAISALATCLDVNKTLDHFDTQLAPYITGDDFNVVKQKTELLVHGQKCRFSACIIPVIFAFLCQAFYREESKCCSVIVIWLIALALHIAADVIFFGVYNALKVESLQTTLGWEWRSRFEWVNFILSIAIHHVFWGIVLFFMSCAAYCDKDVTEGQCPCPCCDRRQLPKGAPLPSDHGNASPLMNSHGDADTENVAPADGQQGVSLADTANTTGSSRFRSGLFKDASFFKKRRSYDPKPGQTYNDIKTKGKKHTGGKHHSHDTPSLEQGTVMV